MRDGSLRRGLWLLLLTCLLLTDLSYAAAAGKAWKLSSSQRRFVNVYGYPQLFMLVFDYPGGKGTSRPRRIESWIYLKRSSFVIFDNGFFSEEQPSGATVADRPEAPRTRLKPSAFHSAMKENDVTRAYGRPDYVETADFGGRHFRTLRYLKKDRAPGILNVTFQDGRLAGVVAGFAIQAPDPEVLKREIRRGVR